MIRALAFVLCCLFSAPALAQIIYEPVKYQYRCSGQTYYYGGTNPSTFAFAAQHAKFRYYGHERHLGVAGEFVRHKPVYHDALPWKDATFFGLGSSDARDAAYRSVPLYFRKSDLLATGAVDAGGALIVPSQFPPAPGTSRHDCPEPVPYRAVPASPMYRAPIVPRGQIIIIPKHLLDRPLRSFETKRATVTLAE